jgi:hypothetical protein
MDEPSKMQALPMSEVRERLLNKRHDGFVMAHRASNATPATESASRASNTPVGNIPAKKAAPPPPPEEKICAYSKCGVKFTPRRPDQHYHTADCRKRAWFDRNFAPIAKPGGE